MKFKEEEAIEIIHYLGSSFAIYEIYESYATQDFIFGKVVENNYNFRVGNFNDILYIMLRERMEI